MRLAAALAARGLSVVIAEPHPGRVTATYGIFERDLPQDLEDAVVARWPSVEFRTQAETQDLALPYARLDSERLHTILSKACADRCEWHAGRVDAVEPEEVGVTVRFADGSTLRAGRVIDCSGHGRALGQVTSSLAQVALGATLRGAHGLSSPRFMDFSGPEEGTFLYALPLSPTELFVEETALVSARDPDWFALEARLRRRLAGMGLEGDLDVHERCVIPMDSSLPDSHGPVLFFGAAAGLVHPATGYQLGASLACVEPFADAVCETMTAPAADAAERCMGVLWPAERRHVRELRLFGAQFVSGLAHADQASFFATFFRLPIPLIEAYLSHDGSLDATCRAMLRVYTSLPARLKWSLTRAGVRQPMTLVRPLLDLRGSPSVVGVGDRTSLAGRALI